MYEDWKTETHTLDSHTPTRTWIWAAGLGLVGFKEREGGEKKRTQVGGQICEELGGVHTMKLHCSKFSKNKALKDRSRRLMSLGVRTPESEDRDSGHTRAVSQVTKSQR